jgi:hypothetical protein
MISKLIMIASEPMRAAVTAQPASAMAMMRAMSSELGAMTRQVVELKARSAAQRLGTYLLNMVSEPTATKTDFRLPVNKGLLASWLGAVRRTCRAPSWLCALMASKRMVPGFYCTISPARRPTPARRWPTHRRLCRQILPRDRRSRRSLAMHFGCDATDRAEADDRHGVAGDHPRPSVERPRHSRAIPLGADRRTVNGQRIRRDGRGSDHL